MAGVNKKTENKKLSPFDFLNSINSTKINLLNEDNENTKYYNSYIINRSLSYFPDTIFYANEMNRLHHLDDKLQYEFFLGIVRKKRRFSKWDKSKELNSLNEIKRYFGYSNEKAKQALSVLSDQQITIIKEKVNKGGRK